MPKKSVGWTLRLLRWCFNLILILVTVALIAVSGIYLYVTDAYDDQLDERYPDLIENSAVYDVGTAYRRVQGGGEPADGRRRPAR